MSWSSSRLMLSKNLLSLKQKRNARKNLSSSLNSPPKRKTIWSLRCPRLTLFRNRLPNNHRSSQNSEWVRKLSKMNLRQSNQQIKILKAISKLWKRKHDQHLLTRMTWTPRSATLIKRLTNLRLRTRISTHRSPLWRTTCRPLNQKLTSLTNRSRNANPPSHNLMTKRAVTQNELRNLRTLLSQSDWSSRWTLTRRSPKIKLSRSW